MRNLLPTWLGGSVRWVAIVALFLASAECFTRVEDRLTWGVPLLSPYSNSHLLLQDSLGFRGRPDYRYQKWRMNNLGFRGADISLTPAPGRVRIAVVGASETFGLYESEGAEYPARMQMLLDSMAPGRFEVVNAGLPGMSLASMISYFDRAVHPLQPQLLFIYPSPAFYLEITPLPVEYRPPRFVPSPPRHVGPWVVEGDAIQSRLAGRSREVLKQLVPTAVVTGFRQWRLDRVRAARGPDWVWPTVPAERMEILRRHLERLLTSLQGSGVGVVLVTHTNRFVNDRAAADGPDRRHLVNLMSAYYPRASPAVLLTVDSVANTIIRDVAPRYGARVVDAEGRIPSSPEYLADYLHFTDAGADQMARLLAASALEIVDSLTTATGAGQP